MQFLKSKHLVFAINLIFLLTIALLLMDYKYGDGNGVVKYFDLTSPAKWLGILAGIVNFRALFMLKKPWLQDLLMVSLVTGLLLWLVNWFFGKLLVYKYETAPAQRFVFPTYPRVLDDNLGYKLPADSTIVGMKKMRNDTVVYSIDFKTDSHGYRITPGIENATPTQYAMFLGCSYTFGEGLKSTETLAYNFQKENPAYNGYNLGFSGYGPHQALARMQEGKLRNTINEQNGVAIYTYIPDHINRATACSQSYGNMNGHTPWFEKVEGNIVRKGMFADIKDYRQWLYKFVLSNPFFRYFDIAWPMYHSQSQYELLADILIETSKLYKKQFGNDNYYILLYPSKQGYGEIIPLLQKAGVKYLDYSKLFDPDAPQHIIKYDGHPSALANQLLIKQLTTDLKVQKLL